MSTITPTAELKAIIAEVPSDPAKIARFLDALEHEQQVSAIRSLGARHQRLLWQAVDGFASIRLADIVPASVPAMTPVRHYGKNSLPLFTVFEKRFYRPPSSASDNPNELCGCNFTSMMSVIGPGYYVAIDDPKRPEVLIDYRRVPLEKPDDWPAIRPNDKGLSRFVYGFMVDTLRRVSEHVTIGSAARNGKAIDSWFVLCREANP
jgi:hypothetical protein